MPLSTRAAIDRVPRSAAATETQPTRSPPQSIVKRCRTISSHAGSAAEPHQRMVRTLRWPTMACACSGSAGVGISRSLPRATSQRPGSSKTSAAEAGAGRQAARSVTAAYAHRRVNWCRTRLSARRAGRARDCGHVFRACDERSGVEDTAERGEFIDGGGDMSVRPARPRARFGLPLDRLPGSAL